jgi:hypothetical protein
MAVLRIGSKCSHDNGLSPLPISPLAGKKNKIRYFPISTGSTGSTGKPANLKALSAILEIASI